MVDPFEQLLSGERESLDLHVHWYHGFSGFTVREAVEKARQTIRERGGFEIDIVSVRSTDPGDAVCLRMRLLER